MSTPGFATRKLRVNGVELNVLLAGPEDGAAVLLLHGFPDDHTVWRHQVPALAAAGYRVVAPDTRGCGDSELLPRASDYRLEYLVADQVALLDALGIRTAKLLGHDWGAVQGWHLAMRHPERFDRYLAMSVGHPWCYLRAGWRQKVKGWYAFFFQLRGLARWAFTAGDFAFARRFADFGSEWPRVQERFLRPGRFAAGQNYYVANLWTLMRAPPVPVQVPVMGVYSSGDRYLTEEQMTLSERLVPRGWRYERLDGVNHWMQLDAPERVTALMLDYFGEQL